MRRRILLTLAVVAVLSGCLRSEGPDTSRADVQPAGLGVSWKVIDTGFAGYEPSIGIADGRILLGGASVMPAEEDGAGAFSSAVVRSGDAGATWQLANVFPVTFDPILHADAVTDRVYRAHMLSTECTSLAWSDDGGTTWTERPGACGSRGVDFIKLGSGVAGPESNPDVGPDTTHVVYLCHNRNNDVAMTSVCAMSYDGGLTWPAEAVAAHRERDGCGGVTSFPAVGPDGTAVLPLGGGCQAMHLALSRDSGATWTVEALPYSGGVAVVTPRAAFDDAGRLYVVWADWQFRIHVAIRDPGGPWTGSVFEIPGLESVTHLAMDVLGPGEIGFAFFGTGDTAGDPSQAPGGTRWDLYGGIWRIDGTVVWALEEEVQYGRICYGGSGCPRNLGDFFDAAAGPDGALYMAYVDGCDGCRQSQSTDTYLKVLRVAPADA